MKLLDLDPRWFTFAHCDVDLRIGLTFLCPHCRQIRLGVQFEPAIDPGFLLPTFGIVWPVGDRPIWHRTGDTFETLTLTPSIDASGCQIDFTGHWHGFITNGEVT